MMRYLTTTRKEDKLILISKILKAIAIIEIIIAIVALCYEEINFVELEGTYSVIEKVEIVPKMSVKEQAHLYIQSLEVPEVQFYVEEKEEYYNPTEEERQMAYLIAKSEAGIEDAFGKILVINVAINNMKASGYSSLIEEFTASGRYSSVINGVPCTKQNDEWIPVTEEMLDSELKSAVEMAFEKDYTEELLKEVAEAKGLDETYYKDGALYFYNPKAVSDYQASLRANIQVSFQYGRHVFYRVWDK